MRKLALYLSATILSTTIGFFAFSQTTQAVSAADWNPGRIIDDVVFQNKNAMSVAQIQQFLDSKVPVCDRNGTTTLYDSAYGDTVSRATYSARRGVSTPFTCLKEYVENPTTKENNVGRPTATIPGGLSAAQLIFNAAQAQNINPQVYLVLLQKEQSLVTDDWPWPKQFERATGNNCPDTAPCNPQYAWLWTQVNNAGAQFNYYVNNFDEFNYAPGQNTILYSPNSSCGSRSVFIENRFTAALYIYTPYTPNQAALNNMYGTGDSCSAYGNRNFWRMFNDWFGSTYVDTTRDSDNDGLPDISDLCSFEAGVMPYQGCDALSNMTGPTENGDFNGDGYGDVAVLSGFPDGKTFNVWLYAGTSTGALQEPQFQFTLGPNFGGWDFKKSKTVSTNVNGDQYVDLVIFHQGPNNEIVRHTLKGSATGLTTADPSSVTWQFPSQGWLWTNMRIIGNGDFNGDGYGDVATYQVSPYSLSFDIYIYRGNSNGSLQAPVYQFTLGPQSGGWDFRKSKTLSANTNGDGYMDIVVFHQGPNNEVVRHILQGSSSGIQQANPALVTWQFPSQGWLWTNMRYTGTGDFNGDGYGDVAVLSGFPDGKTFNVWLYAGTSTGALQEPQFQFTLGPNFGGWDFKKSKTVSTNVNGDQYVDLVIFHQGPNNEIVRHTLKGSATGLTTADPSSVTWQFPSQGWLWTNMRPISQQ